MSFVSNLNIKPGALITRNHSGYEGTGLRDLNSLIDSLRRENERKDNRNELLSKDMVTLRTANTNMQVS